MIRVSRTLLKKTIRAMATIIDKYYTDCYNTEADIQRLRGYETKLKGLLGYKPEDSL